ncbi:hypothetical protein WH47_05937 [Habropoda laboriosa]|uniref:Mos1 transposase HTH domain-containing protein n=1 Tax=Habropoda laboriosa TaxID=597456 RepID=A0A0L7REL8_9HYME|nr:hypothetical protein WH47_05937 [Habropoda laboriosa]
MATDKVHTRRCILFAFQLNKNVAEAAEMIRPAFGENAVIHAVCKSVISVTLQGKF